MPLLMLGGALLHLFWPEPPAPPHSQAASPEQVRALENANQRLRKKIEGLAPSGAYVVMW